MTQIQYHPGRGSRIYELEDLFECQEGRSVICPKRQDKPIPVAFIIGMPLQTVYWMMLDGLYEYVPMRLRENKVPPRKVPIETIEDPSVGHKDGIFLMDAAMTKKYKKAVAKKVLKGPITGRHYNAMVADDLIGPDVRPEVVKELHRKVERLLATSRSRKSPKPKARVRRRSR